jgi:hypothetical protein
MDAVLMLVVPGVLIVALIADVWILIDFTARCWAKLLEQS